MSVLQTLKVVLILLLFRPICCVCPKNLHSSCYCAQGFNGFDIRCQDVGDDLGAVLVPLGKLRIERLAVYGAHWPVLKPLPSLSVVSMVLASCGIEEVEEMAFQKTWESLMELVLINNSLSTIPSFGHLPNLVSLNLKYNKISDVQEGAFQNMSRLTHLRLDGNKICSINRNVFNEIKSSLQLLDLSGNCLESIPAGSLSDSPQMTHLDLSENRIAVIGDYNFRSLPNLKELRLDSNQINEIGTLAFKDVPELQVLSMHDNLLSEFDISALIEGFRRLEIIDLARNNLVEVPVLKGLPNIRQIKLDYNKISRIESQTFNMNPLLRYLSLENNEITKLSSHCFSNLIGLTRLLLANNLIRSIDRDVFSGMVNLEELSLQNNSLNELESYTFSGLPALKMLDLSLNSIHNISVGTFKNLPQLSYVDLSGNLISTLEKGTFEAPIVNIILYGNPIQCDNKIEWLVEYLKWNRIRTHLPYQSEVMCVTPEKYASVRLRDFKERKENETLAGIAGAFRMATGGTSGQSIFDKLVPAGVRRFLPGGERTENDAYSKVPVLGAMTRAFPGLGNMPGLNYAPQATGQRAGDVVSMNNAIEKFASPLIRVVSGESSSLGDINDMVQAIPDLAANMPGVTEIDLNTVSPDLILNLLRGGQIPGVENETLQKILKKYSVKMYEAAAAAKSGHPLQDEAHYLPSLEKFPKELVTKLMKEGSFPYLTKEQLGTIKGYYMTKIATAISKGDSNIPLPEGIITPQMKSMMKLLPPNYDISKIPQEVLEAVAEGRVPDVNILPKDLRDHILSGGLAKDGNDAKPGVSADEVLRNHMSTEQPLIPESERYDINKVSVDLVKAEEEAQRKQRLRYCSYILLCVVGAVSSVVMVFVFRYMKHRRAIIAEQKLDSFCSPESVTPHGPEISSSRSRSSLTAENFHVIESANHSQGISRSRCGV